MDWVWLVGGGAVLLAGGFVWWARGRRRSDAAPAFAERAGASVPAASEAFFVAGASGSAAAGRDDSPAVATDPLPASAVAPARESAPALAAQSPVPLASRESAAAPQPRSQVPAVERILPLEVIGKAEWDAATPLALSPVQAAGIAAALAPMAGAAAYRAVRFDAGAAIRIARGDLAFMKVLSGVNAGIRAARWLGSSASTTLAATTLAALARERHFDALGAEVQDLKAVLAALAPRPAAQGDGRIRALVQDLSRFAREARENYVSVIGKSAFREHVGQAWERALDLWRELPERSDGIRQQLEVSSRSFRFGEVQVEKALAQLRELHDQERLQGLVARMLAALHTLRLTIGDAAPVRGADPLSSAEAALQAGLDQGRDLKARLADCEKSAKGDPYVGKAEFEANRAALRKLLERPGDEAIVLAMSRLESARTAPVLDPVTATGDMAWVLIGPATPEAACALRLTQVMASSR